MGEDGIRLKYFLFLHCLLAMLPERFPYYQFNLNATYDKSHVVLNNETTQTTPLRYEQKSDM